MNKALLALDIGDSRIGVAVCEHGASGPRPLGTFNRAQGNAEQEIIKIIKELDIQTVIAGLPLDEAGLPTKQCERVEQFCRRLERRSTAKIIYQDEYASTHEAQERLNQSTGRRKSNSSGNRGLLDAFSAAIILESYLKQTNIQPHL